MFPYASAAAFRTALRDRFAVIAKSETRYSLDELQRQFSYDRALAWLFTAPDAASLPARSLPRRDYDSTRITMVSASTPSYAIASAPASDCMRAMTASMSATSMSTAT